MKEKKIEFPMIVEQMKKHNEKQKDLALLVNLDSSQISRKIAGIVGWSLDEIETLCKHYNIDFYKLFKRKEK